MSTPTDANTDTKTSTPSPPPSTLPFADLRITVEDVLRNTVAAAGANHHEIHVQPLSNTEKFYVNVADVFLYQQKEKAKVTRVKCIRHMHVWDVVMLLLLFTVR